MVHRDSSAQSSAQAVPSATPAFRSALGHVSITWPICRPTAACEEASCSSAVHQQTQACSEAQYAQQRGCAALLGAMCTYMYENEVTYVVRGAIWPPTTQALSCILGVDDGHAWLAHAVKAHACSPATL